MATTGIISQDGLAESASRDSLFGVEDHELLRSTYKVHFLPSPPNGSVPVQECSAVRPYETRVWMVAVRLVVLTAILRPLYRRTPPTRTGIDRKC